MIRPSWRVSVGAVAALALLSTGCVMPDQLSQIQKDLADVRQQLRRVEDAQATTENRLAAIEEQRSGSSETVSREEFADLAVRVDRASNESSIAGDRLNDLNARIDRLTQELQRTREMSRSAPPAAAGGTAATGPEATGRPGEGEAAAPGGPAVVSSPGQGGDDAVPDANALYNTAYADYSKGNYALAISGFQEYVERFPDSPLADNALYWIGECQFSQGNFSDAIAAFDQLLDFDEHSDKAAAANLKKALAFLEQNQIAQAIVQLRYVTATYPGSDEAKIARDKLTSLGAPL